MEAVKALWVGRISEETFGVRGDGTPAEPSNPQQAFQQRRCITRPTVAPRNYKQKATVRPWGHLAVTNGRFVRAVQQPWLSAISPDHVGSTSRRRPWCPSESRAAHAHGQMAGTEAIAGCARTADSTSRRLKRDCTHANSFRSTFS